MIMFYIVSISHMYEVQAWKQVEGLAALLGSRSVDPKGRGRSQAGHFIYIYIYITAARDVLSGV